MNNPAPDYSASGRDKDILNLELSYEIPIEPSRLFVIVSDTNQWPETLGVRVLKSQPSSRLVVALSDFSRPEFKFEATTEGSRVTVLHDLIKSPEDKKEYRKLWNAWFKSILKRVAL